MDASEGRPPVDAVVIGGSAGSVEALSLVLGALPRDFPVPIVVVIHIPPNRQSLLAEVFRARTSLPVAEATDKTRLVAPGVWFAPPNYHLHCESNGTLALSTDAPVLYARPSIDVLFESAADALGTRLLGIILSGASSDGAQGLAAILARGGRGWVQLPQTAQAGAMPRAALAENPTAQPFSPEEMGERLGALGRG